MTERRQLLGLELAACALAATVALMMLVVGIDAVRFHRAALFTMLILAVESVALAVMVASFTRQVLRQRAFLARLPTEARTIFGRELLVIPSRRAYAFCAGFLRPRVVVSDGLCALLSEQELLSVIEHERHHARRRDPLRRALVKALCDGFWFIPALRGTARTHATISELAADAVAIRSAGSGSLASALVAFEDHGTAGAGADAERIEHLLGKRTPQPAGRLPSVVTAAVLLALGGALVYLLRPVPAELCLPLSTALGAPLAVLFLALACVPAGLLGRTAARRLRLLT